MSKKDFIEIYTGLIHREGADKLLTWLERSDFFTAPASTRFHGAYEGGLCEHSVNVFKRLCDLVDGVSGIEQPTVETLAIVSLLHDLCKVNFYTIDFRNKKNEQGVWERVPFYTIDDQFPFGHGDKSVYIVSSFMKLSREEATAIRFHMGAWQEGEARLAGQAFEKYPLAVLLHEADMLATYLDEQRGPQ